MTHSPPQNIENLDKAIACLLEQIGHLIDEADGDIPTERMDKLAKSISVHLKAHADTTAHNRNLAARETAKKYTRYEDLPPLSPEDRERFKARFLDLISRLQAGKYVPDHPEEAICIGDR
mgnify:CR=1 FL=1